MWKNAVGEISEPVGELTSLDAQIIEIKPEEIPLAKGVDIEAMRAYDDDPLEVVVEIPESKSTRGWYYTKEAIGDIVDAVKEGTLSGFLGHQKAEDVSNVFETPVTHWIGAEMRDNKGYFRGMVDKAAPDLKRWIRTGRIKEVSIFGYPTLEKKDGETNVVGYQPLSIDWTPLHRPGMPTRIVGQEMDSQGEMESVSDLSRAIDEEAQKIWPDGVWTAGIFHNDKYAIVEVNDRKLYRVNYDEEDDGVTITDYFEVKREVRYVPVEEGEHSMNKDEMLDLIKEEIEKGSFTLDDLTRSLSVKPVKGEIDALKEKLGISGEIDMEAYLKEAIEAKRVKEEQAHGEMIEAAVKEKVSGELNQSLIMEMMKNSEAKTKEEACGEIGALLENDVIKTIINKANVEQGTGVSGEIQHNSGVVVKRSMRF